MILQWSWPHVSRFKKQSVFDLNGRGFNAAAALGGEDHQLGGVLPRAALLDMVGLIQENSTPRKKSSPTAAVPIVFSLMRRSLFFGRGDTKLDDWKTVYRSGAPLVCPSSPALNADGCA
jgi:hypothetical protein